MAPREVVMKRRLYNQARSFEVDPDKGRFVVRPLRAWYLVIATACASMGTGPWLVTRLGPHELSFGGWIVVLTYLGAALALAGIALSPTNRRIELDVARGEVTVGARFGLGRPRRIPMGEVRFGYRERLMPVGDIVACRASVAHLGIGEPTIVETTRDASKLPKRLAHALEEARRDSDGRHLELAVKAVNAAPSLALRDIGVILAAVLVGPFWMWWYLL